MKILYLILLSLVSGVVITPLLIVGFGFFVFTQFSVGTQSSEPIFEALAKGIFLFGPSLFPIIVYLLKKINKKQFIRVLAASYLLYILVVLILINKGVINSDLSL